MSESDRLLMKSKPAPRQNVNDFAVTLQSHWFNAEAMVANNFGQGDDHSPADPMHDSPLLTPTFPLRPKPRIDR